MRLQEENSAWSIVQNFQLREEHIFGGNVKINTWLGSVDTSL